MAGLSFLLFFLRMNAWGWGGVRTVELRPLRVRDELFSVVTRKLKKSFLLLRFFFLFTELYFFLNLLCSSFLLQSYSHSRSLSSFTE